MLALDADTADIGLTEEDYGTACSILDRQMRSPDGGTRSSALICLWSLGPRASSLQSSLMNALRDSLPAVRAAAVRTVAKVIPNAPETKVSLVQLCSDPSSDVRAAASDELKRLPSRIVSCTIVRRGARLAGRVGATAPAPSRTALSCLACETVMLDLALLDYFLFHMAGPERRDALMKAVADELLVHIRRPPDPKLDGLLMVTRFRASLDARAQAYGIALASRSEMDFVRLVLSLDDDELLLELQRSSASVSEGGTNPKEVRNLLSVMPATLLMNSFLSHIDDRAARSATDALLNRGDPADFVFTCTAELADLLLKTRKIRGNKGTQSLSEN